jgi:hypothetical protein
MVTYYDKLHDQVLSNSQVEIGVKRNRTKKKGREPCVLVPGLSLFIGR